MNYRDACLAILQLDASITFACIASMEGGVLAAEYKPEFAPTLTREESQLAVMQALIRLNMKEILEEKLGSVICSLTLYENEKRATIPLYKIKSNSSNRIRKTGEYAASGDSPERKNEADAVLILSLGNDSDHDEILSKVMRYLRQAQLNRSGNA